jgi:3D (Asp-Asp-Asp) domain-containing protein
MYVFREGIFIIYFGAGFDLNKVPLKKIGLILGGLIMLVGFVVLAESFFRHPSSDKITAGYALLTPPFQSWRTSFPSSGIVTSTNKGLRQVTAYNVGDRNQTSSTPCTAANGENICAAVSSGEKRCAANFVKLGTVIHIQDYGLCKVTDRMHRRYNNRVDIALPQEEKGKAKQFGVQQLKVTELTQPVRTAKSSTPSSQPQLAQKRKNSQKKVIAQYRAKKSQKVSGKRTLIAQADKKI